MDLALARCFVQVHDPESAPAFYRDALGAVPDPADNLIRTQERR